MNILLCDFLMAFRPDFLLVQQALRAGEWPLWNPLEHGGVPLLANCQSTVFLPSRLLLLFLDVDTAMSLFILIKLWACGMVAYISARLFTLSVWPARFFSVAWGFSCVCLVWLYWPVSTVAVWSPLVLAGADLIARSRLRQGFFALALGGAMLLFAGHPEIAFAFGMYIALYFVVRILAEWSRGSSPSKPLLVFAAAWLLALGVYSVQLFPFLEYVSVCKPMGTRDMPVTPGALTTFWVPRFWGVDVLETFWDKTRYNSNLTIQHYAGMATWIGLAVLLAGPSANRLSWRRRNQLLALALSAALAMAIAMDIPLLGAVNHLPGFNLLRMQYHEYFVLLALPLAAAFGLEKWLSSRRRLRNVMYTALLLLPAAAIVAPVYWQNQALLKMQALDGYVQKEIITALVAVSVVLAILAASCLAPRLNKLWWTLLIAAAFIDQTWAVRGINPTLPRQGLIPQAQLITYLQAKPRPCRINVLGASIVRGTIGNFGLEEWEGYDGLFPERPIRFREELGTNIWKNMLKACSVDYYLNDPRFPELFPIAGLVQRGVLKQEVELDKLQVFHHEAMLPRARLVANVEVAASTGAAFQRMLDETFDPSNTVITDMPVGDMPAGGDTSSPGEASITSYSPNHVAVSYTATKRAVLVLADTYYPGWNAYVDGRKATIFPAYYAFRGVLVPEGKHTLEFRYEPRSLTIGLAVSFLALLCGFYLAVQQLPRGPNRR